MIARVLPYGERAAYVDLGLDAAPDRAARTHALGEALGAALPHADVIVGAGSVVVVGEAIDRVRALAASPPPARSAEPTREHVIASLYDGPDLAEVAATLGISPSEAIARHAATLHVVELLGFLPGFAYLAAPSGAPLTVPRRSTPRPRIAAGSIGVAASWSAVYPFTSPGGWSLIGRAVDAVPFDPTRDPPLLFAPGDQVRFSPVEVAPPAIDERAVEPRDPRAPGLLVIAAPACATVQDAGRVNLLGRGVPPSGPLDAPRMRAANQAVGNDAGAAAIEIPLGAIEVEARGSSALVSVDGEPAITLADGERLRVPAGERAVRYLAARGGVDVPRVLGARATLIPARLGGHHGRPLRRGDVLPIGDEAARDPTRPDRRDDEDELSIDPGPHRSRFPEGAFEALLAAPFQVSRLGDRVGVRLEGARVPREGPDLALPAPMIRGAIEITTDGSPIVLGPDHPTTGGYPVLAVLRASSQAALAQKKPGDAVRFRQGR